MNHCKNRLLTWIYSVFFASPIAVKTPKDEVTCDIYWNFYKKLKIWTCFPQNGGFRDQTGGRETTSQKGSLQFKTGGLEHMQQTKLCSKPIVKIQHNVLNLPKFSQIYLNLAMFSIFLLYFELFFPIPKLYS